MSALRVLLAGAWELVVGEDWRTAVGVAIALGVTALAAGSGVSAWWVLPVAVLALLAISVRHAARGARAVAERERSSQRP